MKQSIEALLLDSLSELSNKNHIPPLDPSSLNLHIEHTKDPAHGDFATNVALIHGKAWGMNPRALATLLVEHLKKPSFLEKTEIAGPGFINFYLSPVAQHSVIETILKEGHHFGQYQEKNPERILLEFVSANPNGPLHVGHGRGAALGATLANILSAVGHEVHKEYYVNDAGRQMDILALSVWLRYLELLGETLSFPVNGYRGDYVRDMAALLLQKQGEAFHHSIESLFIPSIPPDETAPGIGDKEAHVDALIAQAKSLLGATAYETIHQHGLTHMLKSIHDDLADFQVSYDQWYSEKSLFKSNALSNMLNTLKEKGFTYEKEGNLWFSSTTFGDEKDRVLVRKNGVPTYFASDAAYHYDKLFLRNIDKIINIFGADHHGYIPRLRAAMEALGVDPKRMIFLTVQFATLWRGDTRVQMSTRSGSFVTLKELCEEVGTDAARFFYVLRKPEQHMDFDLELAKSASTDNPVYYIQYAHARICSVLNQLLEKNLSWDQEEGLAHIHLLTAPQEKTLINTLTQYPDTLKIAARQYEPHLLAHYLRTLAHDFHSLYNTQQFLVPETPLRNARLSLAMACKILLSSGLTLLNVSAPASM